jgi:hypothetical protein
VGGTRLGAVLLVILLVAAPVASGRRANDRANGDSAGGATHDRAGHQALRGRNPTDVRTTLEELLGQHAIVAIRMMRAQIEDVPNLVQILRDALSVNTADLVDAVRSVYGSRAAAKFKTLWTDHNVALIEYAEAVATNDQDAEEASKDKLDRYRVGFGQFAEAVTNSRLKAASVARTLSIHINHLLEQSQAYAAGNYGAAYRLQRDAYAHMFPIGQALAGSPPTRRPGELPIHLQAPAQKLRSALGLLLGEHVELLVDATRAAVVGLPEFRQAAAALNGNTGDLAEAFSGLVGNKNAGTFADLWAGHIDQFIDYAAAVAKNNESQANLIRSRLKKFAPRLGAFLVRVTGEKRGMTRIARAVSKHDDLLLEQINAYARSEYGAAHRASYHAYHDMFSIAKGLSAVIARATQKGAPKGAAQTGGGGTATNGLP